MKLFQCSKCQHVLYFENTRCERCKSPLGYLPELEQLVPLVATTQKDIWETTAMPSASWRYCENHQQDVCNWLIAADDPDELCSACRLNRHIPNLSDSSHHEAWRALEVAKHRLVYSLYRFHLPLASKLDQPDSGLAFDFVDEDGHLPEGVAATTGHAEGLVTININEADNVEREQMREDMDESYRTLIGHFRHEIGHYYWELLVQPDDEVLARFRSCFGDERANYGESMARYYQEGAPASWRQQFISAYATSHPWEDWAESWAHYLHLIDMLETAFAFGLSLAPAVDESPSGESLLSTEATFDPYLQQDFGTILDVCLPVTYAVNSLNRSMGQPDVYPFVLSDAVVAKLAFIHELLWHWRQATPQVTVTRSGSV
ncbi:MULTISPECIES: putative zinc-binding metallopeptidase [unclassified Oceanobacter]|uniref:zinc-binding metallopeptidase family protein n=1 Tax=unclassified Oceanobacter TaxID=2620260 RepID=UPI0027344C4F|nr:MULTISPECIES: putative zinc-binding metallopeptidase [unclassified Oceanobacter]MDP2506865.1 putative zinc-binding metallopeptidase [Oceanobacter sp. 3_MG-2023]MDP2547826.1 putative zinc-binding metallopeptidase [Oceanobacter sp. 4_MG-2023]MDP2608882.1 putative zinc-binding metallopeptidase [Oceanobacter sp. 1_MG-2023]MDP2611876.1 putative zinc-binding metallopeptidase [Oceanobacter sp. 2_MG-2023]